VLRRSEDGRYVKTFIKLVACNAYLCEVCSVIIFLAVPFRIVTLNNLGEFFNLWKNLPKIKIAFAFTASLCVRAIEMIITIVVTVHFAIAAREYVTIRTYARLTCDRSKAEQMLRLDA